MNCKNIINRDNIKFDLAGDVIGNIQTQVQTMKMLHQEYYILTSLKGKLSKFKYSHLYLSRSNIEINEIRDKVAQSEERIEQFINWIKDLTNTLTSKGNVLQFQMCGEDSYEDIKIIFKEIENMISIMLRNAQESQEIKQTRAQLDESLKQFDSRIRF